MIVRNAVAADMAGMIGAVEDFARLRYPADEMDAGQVQSVLTEIITSDDGLCAVLAHDDNRFAGMFAAVAHKNIVTGKPTCGEVFFYVSPDARGHGRKLLRFAEDWARGHGCASMTLCHTEATPELEKAYSFWGYAPQERHYRKDFT